MTAPTKQDLQTVREFFLFLEELRTRANADCGYSRIYAEARQLVDALNDAAGPSLDIVLSVWRRVIESLEAESGDQESEERYIEPGPHAPEIVNDVMVPKDYSFDAINEFVHHTQVHCEELQWALLGAGMNIDKQAAEIERLRKRIAETDDHPLVMAEGAKGTTEP